MTLSSKHFKRSLRQLCSAYELREHSSAAPLYRRHLAGDKVILEILNPHGGHDLTLELADDMALRLGGDHHLHYPRSTKGFGALRSDLSGLLSGRFCFLCIANEESLKHGFCLSDRFSRTPLPDSAAEIFRAFGHEAPEHCRAGGLFVRAEYWNPENDRTLSL